MSEILDFENTEKQTETPSEEVPAETLLPEEPAVTEEVPQPAAEDAHAEDTAVPDPFGPVNTGSIPLEVPAAADSGYISPYSAQSAAGLGRQRTDADGEPAGERAGFWPRLAAFLIDAVIATVLWGILLFLFGLFTDRLIDSCLEERANPAIEEENRVFADSFRICDENHFMKVFGK